MTNLPKSQFENATVAFHQALRLNDSAALLALVADDVVLMPPGEGTVRGKSAMRDWYAGFLSAYRTASLTLFEREVFVADQLAVELRAYEWGLRPTTGGDPVIDRGKYMQVWTRNSDGQWCFARGIWNSSVMPTASSAH